IVDEVCLAEEYINGLSQKEQTRVLALINRILHHGPPQNELRFRHIGDQIYELKTRGGTRILGFYGGEYLPNSLILAQGFYKPKNKILMRQKKRTMKWREPNIEIIE
ncbi:MAG: type II toxin-antitoxin system RelE/ParE family toxin, partial [Candidatus Heimdallarchaeota archaeon]|nr:type II toxin-antitoxin system RelE/ParE family toxin [Candidatus Heimdallarchaeota archaeon]